MSERDFKSLDENVSPVVVQTALEHKAKPYFVFEITVPHSALVWPWYPWVVGDTVDQKVDAEVIQISRVCK